MTGELDRSGSLPRVTGHGSLRESLVPVTEEGKWGEEGWLEPGVRVKSWGGGGGGALTRQPGYLDCVTVSVTVLYCELTRQAGAERLVLPQQGSSQSGVGVVGGSGLSAGSGARLQR